MSIIPRDFPKLESPFMRELNDKDEYIVTPKIAEGYEWVFNDAATLATEKLHGTNVSIIVENGMIASIWNRTERLPFFNKGKAHIIKGVLEAFERGYCELPDGQWFGELIGEKVNGNPYQIKGHLWIPFATYAREHLAFKSWNATNEDGTLKYPRTFEGISEWFKELMPLYSWKIHGKDWTEGKHFVEGIVFYQPSTGKMAKLRKDMFPDYVGFRHKGVETT